MLESPNYSYHSLPPHFHMRATSHERTIGEAFADLAEQEIVVQHVVGKSLEHQGGSRVRQLRSEIVFCQR